MNHKPNNYAFIDSQNLNLAIRGQGWSLDFGKFRKYLKDKYHIQMAFLFIGYLPGNSDLYDNLQRQGFHLIFKPTMTLPNGKVKGNVDAELVLHAMIEYDNFNKAMIITGDGDFHCLINYLVKKDKLLKLLIPNKDAYSTLLKKVASDKLDFMNNLKNKLQYKNKNLH